MNKIQFVDGPGYINDLILIYTLHFNPKLWSKFANTEKLDEDLIHFNRIIADYQDIPDDLLIFFYLKDGVCTFMTHRCYLYFREKLIQNFGFNNIKDRLADCEEISSNMFFFYFPNHILSSQPGQSAYLSEIAELINASNYPQIIKNGLLTFFVMPDKIIQKLLLDLIAKDVSLSKYYKKHYKVILEAQEIFNVDDFTLKMKNLNNHKQPFDQVNTIFISFCLLAKNTIFSMLYGNETLSVLGVEYQASLKILQNRSYLPNIVTFGKIMSDKKRLEVLEILMNQDEMTTGELAMALSQSVNAAFYHLHMMHMAGMLFTRSEGRSIIFRINYQYFEKMRELMKKFTEANE